MTMNSPRRWGKCLVHDQTIRAAIEAGHTVYQVLKDGYARLTLEGDGEIHCNPVQATSKDGFRPLNFRDFRDLYTCDFVSMTPAEIIDNCLVEMMHRGQDPGLILMSKEDRKWLVNKIMGDGSYIYDSSGADRYRGVLIEIDEDCREPRVITEGAARARRRYSR